MATSKWQYSSVFLLCYFTCFPSIASCGPIGKDKPTVNETTTSCEPPDEASEQRKLTNQAQFYPSKQAYGVQSFDITHEAPASQTDSGDNICPVGQAASGGVERRSSCTWKYKTDFDPERIPQTLSVAVCDACDYCLDSDGDEIRNSIMSCMPVTYNMKVLRRSTDCIDGMFKYEMVTERIAVACSCQRF